MKKLWYLSLVVLLLGNVIDGWSAYSAVQEFSMEFENPFWFEVNPLARWCWENFGFIPVLILGKLLLGSVVFALAWWCMRFVMTSRYSSWVGVRASTFFGLYFGIGAALAGTGVLTSIVGPLAMRVVQPFYPMEAVSYVLWTRVVDTVLWVIFGFIGVSVLLFGCMAIAYYGEKYRVSEL